MRTGAGLVVDLGTPPRPRPRVSPLDSEIGAVPWGYPIDLAELDEYFDVAARARARKARIAAASVNEESDYNSFLGLVYRFGYGGHFPVYSRRPAGRDGWHGAVDIPIAEAAVGKLMVRSIGDGIVLGASIDPTFSGMANGGVIVVVKHALPDGRSFLVRYVHLHNMLCSELSTEDRKLVPSWPAFRDWSDKKKIEWTTWLRGRPRRLPLRAGTTVVKGQPLGPLGFLVSGHHLHLEIISRDIFAGFEPTGTRDIAVTLDPATANRYRSIRGDTKNAYWGPGHVSSGWMWYHPLHFLHGLQGSQSVVTRAGVTTASPLSPPAPAPVPPSAPIGSSSGVPQDPRALRKFRLTNYYLAEQTDSPTGATVVPILDAQGHKLAEGSPGFFSKLALEGSGKLLDGRLVNVASKWIAVDPAVYAPVLAYHRQNLAKRPVGYSGLQVAGDRVTHAMTFAEVKASMLGRGYGIQRGIPYVPFRTLAADLGRKANSDPRFRNKGGLVPFGTRVFIREFAGVRLPDRSVHDGWFVVNDTGGGIFGAHFDVFAGTRRLAQAVVLPDVANVWFAGIESRVPMAYDYGLHDTQKSLTAQQRRTRQAASFQG
jgi:hypothetical protein